MVRKNTEQSKIFRVKLIQLQMHQGSPLFRIFRALSRNLLRHPLLPKATFTTSIQPNLGLPRTRPPLTSSINTLLALRYSSILSTSPNHLNIDNNIDDNNIDDNNIDENHNSDNDDNNNNGIP